MGREIVKWEGKGASEWETEVNNQTDVGSLSEGLKDNRA